MLQIFICGSDNDQMPKDTFLKSLGLFSVPLKTNPFQSYEVTLKPRLKGTHFYLLPLYFGKLLVLFFLLNINKNGLGISFQLSF